MVPNLDVWSDAVMGRLCLGNCHNHCPLVVTWKLSGLLRILCRIFQNCEIILSSASCCCFVVARGWQDKGVVREEPQLQLDEGVASGGVWRCDNCQNCHIPRHRQTTRVCVHMDDVLFYFLVISAMQCRDETRWRVWSSLKTTRHLSECCQYKVCD